MSAEQAVGSVAPGGDTRGIDAAPVDRSTIAARARRSARRDRAGDSTSAREDQHGGIILARLTRAARNAPQPARWDQDRPSGRKAGPRGTIGPLPRPGETPRLAP